MSGAKEIIERIQKLEAEKQSLLLEREGFKKQLDERAATPRREKSANLVARQGRFRFDRCGQRLRG